MYLSIERPAAQADSDNARRNQTLLFEVLLRFRLPADSSAAQGLQHPLESSRPSRRFVLLTTMTRSTSVCTKENFALLQLTASIQYHCASGRESMVGYDY